MTDLWLDLERNGVKGIIKTQESTISVCEVYVDGGAGGWTYREIHRVLRESPYHPLKDNHKRTELSIRRCV